MTLELGLALGLNERSYIAINPDKTEVSEVPSDLRGVDRIQYQSFSEFSDQLTKLLSQEFPIQREHEMESQLEVLRGDARKLVAEGGGLKIGDIAAGLGVSVDLAKLVIRPLVGSEFEMEGIKKGARYFPSGHKGGGQ